MKRWNLAEYKNLYQVRHLLSRQNQETLGLLMPVDVYTKDPLLAESNEELAISQILIEREPELMDGPTSARIRVVDYDEDTELLAEPARWDPKIGRFCFRHKGQNVPITREHRDLPQFHQVNVWAVIQSVLQMYEASWVLGRSAPWAFDGIRLIVNPHAGYMANSFYNRHSKALQFYYFGPEDKRVYTCLSHDIIAHGIGHAILDALRPYYYEYSSLQTAAFYEFIGDLTAVVSSLLNDQLRVEVAKATGGDLSRDTIISGLAAEFAHYASGRPHLRSAQNPKTMEDVADQMGPHDWSEVLTGAMWEILCGIFARYRSKPRRGGRGPTDKEALLWAVHRFQRVALQPLDYLPPVDVQFSDYARAVLRADELVDPADEDDFRGLMREIFERRGIGVAVEETETLDLHLTTSSFDRLTRSRTDAYHVLHENRGQLCIPPDQDFIVADLYRTDKTVMGRGKLPREIVVQYTWREDVPLKGSQFARYDGETMPLLCGGTLVFDERGNILYWSRKPGTRAQGAGGGQRRSTCECERAQGEERRKQLLEYVAARVQAGMI